MFLRSLSSLWKSLTHAVAHQRGTTRAKRFREASLRLESLEDRWLPALLDLTSPGAIGAVNGAIFRQVDPQPTGTGVINSFVRIQPHGHAAVGQGYNTDARPLQFDENSSPQFTRALKLGSIPTVNIGGMVYREFLLDINQSNSNPLLSLDELCFFVGSASNLHGLNSAKQLAGLNAVYNLDAGGDNWVKLDARLSHGSGSGDMIVYVPSQLFGANPNSYVYLYSKFGVNQSSNGGFEEWAVAGSHCGRHGPITPANGSISGTVYQVTATANIPFAGATVFIDANHNGSLDANEVSTITSNGANGPIGFYAFTGLATGLGAFSTYDIKDLPSSLPSRSVTLPPASYLVPLDTAGQAETGKDFYFGIAQEPGSIHGTVFQTSGGVVCGECQPRTIPLANITVFVDENRNGTFDVNELSAKTAADGTYAFTNLVTGPGVTYRISIINIVNAAIVPPRDVLLETPGQAVFNVNFFIH